MHIRRIHDQGRIVSFETMAVKSYRKSHDFMKVLTSTDMYNACWPDLTVILSTAHTLRLACWA